MHAASTEAIHLFNQSQLSRGLPLIFPAVSPVLDATLFSKTEARQARSKELSNWEGHDVKHRAGKPERIMR